MNKDGHTSSVRDKILTIKVKVSGYRTLLTSDVNDAETRLSFSEKIHFRVETLGN